MLLTLFLACAHGFTNGRPENLYETTPQAREYTEVGDVKAHSVAYGSKQRTIDTAMQKLVDNAEEKGADGVVNAKAKAGCNIFIIIGIPNCHAKAEGVAVNWGTEPPATKPAQADADSRQ
jgi:uncharacterized protein YbjQ (UPF0145 family)